MEPVKFGESLWTVHWPQGCPNLLSIQKKACPCPQGSSSLSGSSGGKFGQRKGRVLPKGLPYCGLVQGYSLVIFH